MNTQITITNPIKNNLENKLPNYYKVIIEHPSQNKNLLLTLLKNKKGVYIWENRDKEKSYIGYSKNLYVKIKVDLKSIAALKLKDLQSNFILLLYIFDDKIKFEELQNIIQQFKLEYKIKESNLLGIHEQQNTKIYLYLEENYKLIYIFKSKEEVYNKFKMHKKTLKKCLEEGKLYLNKYLFTEELLKEDEEDFQQITWEELEKLVIMEKDVESHHPKNKMIYAINIRNKNLTRKYQSINDLVRQIKGKKIIIKEYLKGTREGYYRKQWKFEYCNSETEA
jgi:hypothetical protein